MENNPQSVWQNRIRLWQGWSWGITVLGVIGISGGAWWLACATAERRQSVAMYTQQAQAWQAVLADWQASPLAQHTPFSNRIQQILAPWAPYHPQIHQQGNRQAVVDCAELPIGVWMDTVRDMRAAAVIPGDWQITRTQPGWIAIRWELSDAAPES